MQFHLMARPRRWWVPPIEAIILAALFLGLTIVAVVVLLALGGEESEAFDVFVMALILPVPFLAAWLTRRDPTQLLSVERRIRWPVIARSALVAVPMALLVFAYEMRAGGEAVFTTETIVLACLFVLVTPLQAASEELLFRAALPQIAGSWVRSPWVAYGLAILPFVYFHYYNWIGLIDIFIFAACMSFLTWRTGGVEAAIALHAANNIGVFAAGAFFPGRVPAVDIDWPTAAFYISVIVTATALTGWLLTRRDSPSPAQPPLP